MRPGLCVVAMLIQIRRVGQAAAALQFHQLRRQRLVCILLAEVIGIPHQMRMAINGAEISHVMSMTLLVGCLNMVFSALNKTGV